MPIRTNLRVFTASGTWHKPPNLFAIDLVLRGAGGSGASGVRRTDGGQRFPGAGGGGGGAVKTNKRIPAIRLPDAVVVTVGPGGGQTAVAGPNNWNWSAGHDGGDSSFGDILRAEGGQGGGQLNSGGGDWNTGGAGGYSVMRGGRGGAYGAASGESVSSGVIALLAGGGGGGAGSYAGTDYGGTSGQGPGGSSGFVPQGYQYPYLWQVAQSGGGAPGGTSVNRVRTPGFPAGGGSGGFGGGGEGGPGAAGLVTVIEYLIDEE
ncbi:hypothetical protein AXA44_02560 [Rhodococcus sp. SC4]|nr:hypothetical protein AXA44_02560 [Rhodococcus sp. SC4]